MDTQGDTREDLDDILVNFEEILKHFLHFGNPCLLSMLRSSLIEVVNCSVLDWPEPEDRFSSDPTDPDAHFLNCSTPETWPAVNGISHKFPDVCASAIMKARKSGASPGSGYVAVCYIT